MRTSHLRGLQTPHPALGGPDPAGRPPHLIEAVEGEDWGLGATNGNSLFVAAATGGEVARGGLTAPARLPQGVQRQQIRKVARLVPN